MDQDTAVVGLLLAMIVLSAIPVFASGMTWMGALLLVMVWTYVLQKKAAN